MQKKDDLEYWLDDPEEEDIQNELLGNKNTNKKKLLFLPQPRLQL